MSQRFCLAFKGKRGIYQYRDELIGNYYLKNKTKDCVFIYWIIVNRYQFLIKLNIEWHNE